MTTPALQYSFKGKKVLVTGGGGGLGSALLSRLYKDGAHVFTLEKDAALVDGLRKEFSDTSKFRAEICDISKWNETQALIESFGPLDHLINCAAVIIREDIMNVQEEQVDFVLGTNLKAQFCTSQAVAKGMISSGIKGTIVNICSVWGHIASSGPSIYSSAKGGSIMLSKSLAIDLGKHGIRVNSISPTSIYTPMYKANDDESDPTWFMNRQPLAGKRVLDVDEVVDAVLFLLSPLSSLTSGTDLVLDGGILAC